ncbi:MAG: hypothetical protein V3S92_06125, partial [Alphaproteobacteria bacterium]
MSLHISEQYLIVTVQTVEAAATAAGQMALVLKTAERGTIAFVVDQKLIDILREKLADAEKFL